MDYQAIMQAVGGYGALGIIAILLWKRQEKMDSDNKEWTNSRINDLKDIIDDLREESRKDKQLFSKALNAFDKSVENNNIIVNKMQDIEKDMKDLKDDMREITNKIQ